jgi:hypothetical protein
MPYWFPDDPHDQRWWAVLHRFAALVARIPELPAVVPGEFTFVGRWDRRGRPNIWEYKHTRTRRLLQLDENLVAYRYVTPRDNPLGPGRYVRRVGGLFEAVYHLELWRSPPPRPLRGAVAQLEERVDSFGSDRR